MVTIVLKKTNGAWSGQYVGPTMYGPSQIIEVSFIEAVGSDGTPLCSMLISWMGQQVCRRYANLAIAEMAARNRLAIIMGTHRKSKHDPNEINLGVSFAWHDDKPLVIETVDGETAHAEPVQPGAYDVDTSKEAADLIKMKAPKIRERVYRFIHEQGAKGATADEVQVALGLTHQTGAPRVTELARLGRIVRTDERRKTRWGRNAGVYISDVFNADAESLTDDIKDGGE